MKKIVLAFCIAMPAWLGCQATLVTLSATSDYLKLYSNSALTTPLTAGLPGVNGDGAILQIGYYSGATTSNLFGNGSFTAMTSDTGRLTTTIGDSVYNTGGVDGTFGFSINFVVGDPVTGLMPAIGTPIAIKFFNGISIAASSTYNAVSDASWLWPTPADTPADINMSFNDSGLQWLGGTGSAFYTSLPITPVPEVSTYGLISGLGLILLAGFQQRRRLVASAAGIFR